MHNRQQGDVRGGKCEIVFIVVNYNLSLVAHYPEAITIQRDNGMFVEAVGYFLGKALDEAEIEYVAGRGEMSLDADADLIVVDVHGFVDTVVGADKGGCVSRG